MHILVTVNAAWNIQNFRLPLIRSFLDAGHRVTILAPPDETVLALKAMGCRFLPLEMAAKGLNPVESLALIARFIRVFKAEAPDVVLSYTIKNNLFGALAAKQLGVPFIPNVTGLGTAFLSGNLLEKVAVFLYRRCFAGLPVVFFQNSDDSALFESRSMVRPEQIRLLPGSGIDLDRFAAAPYPNDDAAPVFLMIARLLRDKGIMEYVEAAQIVRAQNPGAQFRILGAIGSENRTAIPREDVESWVDEGVIDYRGTTDDVRREIAQAHCVVLPSYREGAPRTLIEAAAMARPVIATDVPGCRAVLDEGRSGLFCQVRDGVDLARACLDFVNLSLAEKAAMGQGGRQKMTDEFDQRLVLDAYARAISDVTERAADRTTRTHCHDQNISGPA